MAKSIERIGILRNGDRVIVRKVERVLSKNPKIVATSWLDCSGSGANVYRLVDGRVLLAEHVTLTDETEEFSPRKKAVVEDLEEHIDTENGEEQEQDADLILELQPLSFAALEPDDQDVAVITPTDPEEGDGDSDD